MTDFEMFKTVFMKVDPKNEWQDYYEINGRKKLEEAYSSETLKDYPEWDKEIGIDWCTEHNCMIFIFDKEGNFLDYNP